MTSQLPETLQDIQDAIHALTSSDVSTPSTSDDQWTVRLRLINRAIANWERQDVRWRELLLTSGTYTITAGQSVYDIGDDSFRVLGSLIRCIDSSGSVTYLNVIPAEDVVQYPNASGQFAYITGNNSDGYSLVLGWVPTATDSLTGQTMVFDYYKSAKRLSNATDKSEMGNPNYIVYWAAAQELLFNGRTNLAQNYLDESDDAMRLMKIENELRPAYASNALTDVEVVRNNDAWGD